MAFGREGWIPGVDQIQVNSSARRLPAGRSASGPAGHRQGRISFHMHKWPAAKTLPAAHGLRPEIETVVEGAGVRRGGEDARHSQGVTKVPRHMPRLALRASFSAATYSIE